MSQRNSGSCLPRRNSTCLGNICGNSIDLNDVRFSAPKSNLVYMDKVFSYNEAIGCPLIFPIQTNSDLYRTTLTIGQNGCGCGCNQLGPNAQFEVEDSVVLVEVFRTTATPGILPSQVTVDGIPVETITQIGGQYFIDTTNLIPQIQRDCCLNNNLATKTFFLISNAGPWSIRLKIILTGRVTNDGMCNCFRLEIENAPNTPNINLPTDRLSNFAVNDLSLPCAINGTAPTIRFQFSANAQLQNPLLTVQCQGSNMNTPCENWSCTVTVAYRRLH